MGEPFVMVFVNEWHRPRSTAVREAEKQAAQAAERFDGTSHRPNDFELRLVHAQATILCVEWTPYPAAQEEYYAMINGAICDCIEPSAAVEAPAEAPALRWVASRLSPDTTYTVQVTTTVEGQPKTSTKLLVRTTHEQPVVGHWNNSGQCLEKLQRAAVELQPDHFYDHGNPYGTGGSAVPGAWYVGRLYHKEVDFLKQFERMIRKSPTDTRCTLLPSARAVQWMARLNDHESESRELPFAAANFKLIADCRLGLEDLYFPDFGELGLAYFDRLFASRFKILLVLAQTDSGRVPSLQSWRTMWIPFFEGMLLLEVIHVLEQARATYRTITKADALVGQYNYNQFGE